jgi:hypothetical protein
MADGAGENVGALSVSVEADTSLYETQLGKLQKIAEDTVNKAISVEFKVDDALFATVTKGSVKKQQAEAAKTPVVVNVALQLAPNANQHLAQLIENLNPKVTIQSLDVADGAIQGLKDAILRGMAGFGVPVLAKFEGVHPDSKPLAAGIGGGGGTIIVQGGTVIGGQSNKAARKQQQQAELVSRFEGMSDTDIKRLMTAVKGGGAKIDAWVASPKNINQQTAEQVRQLSTSTFGQILRKVDIARRSIGRTGIPVSSQSTSTPTVPIVATAAISGEDSSVWQNALNAQRATNAKMTGSWQMGSVKERVTPSGTRYYRPAWSGSGKSRQSTFVYAPPGFTPSGVEPVGLAAESEELIPVTKEVRAALIELGMKNPPANITRAKLLEIGMAEFTKVAKAPKQMTPAGAALQKQLTAASRLQGFIRSRMPGASGKSGGIRRRKPGDSPNFADPMQVQRFVEQFRETLVDVAAAPEMEEYLKEVLQALEEVSETTGVPLDQATLQGPAAKVGILISQELTGIRSRNRQDVIRGGGGSRARTARDTGRRRPLSTRQRQQYRDKSGLYTTAGGSAEAQDITAGLILDAGKRAKEDQARSTRLHEVQVEAAKYSEALNDARISAEVAYQGAKQTRTAHVLAMGGPENVRNIRALDAKVAETQQVYVEAEAAWSAFQSSTYDFVGGEFRPRTSEQVFDDSAPVGARRRKAGLLRRNRGGGRAPELPKELTKPEDIQKYIRATWGDTEIGKEPGKEWDKLPDFLKGPLQQMSAAQAHSRKQASKPELLRRALDYVAQDWADRANGQGRYLGTKQREERREAVMADLRQQREAGTFGTRFPKTDEGNADFEAYLGEQVDVRMGSTSELGFSWMEMEPQDRRGEPLVHTRPADYRTYIENARAGILERLKARVEAGGGPYAAPPAVVINGKRQKLGPDPYATLRKSPTLKNLGRTLSRKLLSDKQEDFTSEEQDLYATQQMYQRLDVQLAPMTSRYIKAKDQTSLATAGWTTIAADELNRKAGRRATTPLETKLKNMGWSAERARSMAQTPTPMGRGFQRTEEMQGRLTPEINALNAERESLKKRRAEAEEPWREALLEKYGLGPDSEILGAGIHRESALYDVRETRAGEVRTPTSRRDFIARLAKSRVFHGVTPERRQLLLDNPRAAQWLEESYRRGIAGTLREEPPETMAELSEVERLIAANAEDPRRAMARNLARRGRRAGQETAVMTKGPTDEQRKLASQYAGMSYKDILTRLGQNPSDWIDEGTSSLAWGKALRNPEASTEASARVKRIAQSRLQMVGAPGDASALPLTSEEAQARAQVQPDVMKRLHEIIAARDITKATQGEVLPNGDRQVSAAVRAVSGYRRMDMVRPGKRWAKMDRDRRLHPEKYEEDAFVLKVAQERLAALTEYQKHVKEVRGARATKKAERTAEQQALVEKYPVSQFPAAAKGLKEISTSEILFPAFDEEGQPLGKVPMSFLGVTHTRSGYLDRMATIRKAIKEAGKKKDRKKKDRAGAAEQEAVAQQQGDYDWGPQLPEGKEWAGEAQFSQKRGRWYRNVKGGLSVWAKGAAQAQEPVTGIVGGGGAGRAPRGGKGGGKDGPIEVIVTNFPKWMETGGSGKGSGVAEALRFMSEKDMPAALAEYINSQFPKAGKAPEPSKEKEEAEAAPVGWYAQRKAAYRAANAFDPAKYQAQLSQWTAANAAAYPMGAGFSAPTIPARPAPMPRNIPPGVSPAVLAALKSGMPGMGAFPALGALNQFQAAPGMFGATFGAIAEGTVSPASNAYINKWLRAGGQQPLKRGLPASYGLPEVDENGRPAEQGSSFMRRLVEREATRQLPARSPAVAGIQLLTQKFGFKAFQERLFALQAQGDTLNQYENAIDKVGRDLTSGRAGHEKTQFARKELIASFRESPLPARLEVPAGATDKQRIAIEKNNEAREKEQGRRGGALASILVREREERTLLKDLVSEQETLTEKTKNVSDEYDKQKKSLLTTKDVAKNILTVFAGGILGTRLLGALNMAVDQGIQLAMTAAAPSIDQAMGRYMTGTKVTGDLSQLVRQQAGTGETALAAMATSANLPYATMQNVAPGLLGRAQGQAANQALQQQVDIIRAGVAMGNETLPGAMNGTDKSVFFGTGGPLPFAPQILGTPSTWEQTFNQLSGQTTETTTGYVPGSGVGAPANAPEGYQSGGLLPVSPGMAAGYLSPPSTIPSWSLPAGMTQEQPAVAGTAITTVTLSSEGKDSLRNFNELFDKTGEKFRISADHLGTSSQSMDKLAGQLKATPGMQGIGEQVAKMGKQGFEFQQGGRGITDASLFTALMSTLQKNALTPDVKTMWGENEKAMRASLAQSEYQMQWQINQLIPAQRGMASLVNPQMRMAPGATWLPGGARDQWGGNTSFYPRALGAPRSAASFASAAATQGASAASQQFIGERMYGATVGYEALQRQQAQGREALKNQIMYGWYGGQGGPSNQSGGVVGAPSGERIDTVMNNMVNWGNKINSIRIDVGLQQAALELANFSNSMRLSNRALADAKGLAGMAGGSKYGQVQREQWQLGRQSQQIGFQLTARQLGMEQAVIGFGVSGESPQERAARMQEAQIRNKLQWKQLDISKQQYANEGYLFQEGAVRQVTDLNYQISLLQQQRDVQLNTQAAQEEIATLQARIEAANQTLEAWLANATSQESTVLGYGAQIAAQTGQALTTVMGQVDAIWSGIVEKMKVDVAALAGILGIDVKPQGGGLPPGYDSPSSAGTPPGYDAPSSMALQPKSWVPGKQSIASAQGYKPSVYSPTPGGAMWDPSAPGIGTYEDGGQKQPNAKAYNTAPPASQTSSVAISNAMTTTVNVGGLTLSMNVDGASIEDVQKLLNEGAVEIVKKVKDVLTAETRHLGTRMS